MKTSLQKLVGSLVIAQACSAGAAQPTDAQQIVRAGTTPAVAGPDMTFTGRVQVNQLWPATPQITASGAYVTFEPGARSAWHTHPAGQRLVVVSGVGRTQEWGKPVQELRAGDVVWWRGSFFVANAGAGAAVSGEIGVIAFSKLILVPGEFDAVGLYGNFSVPLLKLGAGVTAQQMVIVDAWKTSKSDHAPE